MHCSDELCVSLSAGYEFFMLLPRRSAATSQKQSYVRTKALVSRSDLREARVASRPGSIPTGVNEAQAYCSQQHCHCGSCVGRIVASMSRIEQSLARKVLVLASFLGVLVKLPVS
jgi:hypothetical protein